MSLNKMNTTKDLGSGNNKTANVLSEIVNTVYLSQ